MRQSSSTGQARQMARAAWTAWWSSSLEVNRPGSTSGRVQAPPARKSTSTLAGPSGTGAVTGNQGRRRSIGIWRTPQAAARSSRPRPGEGVVVQQAADGPAAGCATGAFQGSLPASGALPDSSELKTDPGLADGLHEPGTTLTGADAGGVVGQPAVKVQGPVGSADSSLRRRVAALAWYPRPGGLWAAPAQAEGIPGKTARFRRGRQETRDSFGMRELEGADAARLTVARRAGCRRAVARCRLPGWGLLHDHRGHHDAAAEQR